MELVAFDAAWADSGTKTDLKGLYRGTNGNDRIVVLPCRRHNDWSKKGLVFVTLATAEDVIAVRDQLRAKGVNLNALAQSYAPNGAFRMDVYLSEQPQRDADEAEALKARLSQLEGQQKPARAAKGAA